MFVKDFQVQDSEESQVEVEQERHHDDCDERNDKIAGFSAIRRASEPARRSAEESGTLAPHVRGHRLVRQGRSPCPIAPGESIEEFPSLTESAVRGQRNSRRPRHHGGYSPPSRACPGRSSAPSRRTARLLARTSSGVNTISRSGGGFPLRLRTWRVGRSRGTLHLGPHGFVMRARWDEACAPEDGDGCQPAIILVYSYVDNDTISTY